MLACRFTRPPPRPAAAQPRPGRPLSVPSARQPPVAVAGWDRNGLRHEDVAAGRAPLREKPMVGRVGLGRPVAAKVADLAVDADARLPAVGVQPNLRRFAVPPATHDRASRREIGTDPDSPLRFASMRHDRTARSEAVFSVIRAGRQSPATAWYQGSALTNRAKRAGQNRAWRVGGGPPGFKRGGPRRRLAGIAESRRWRRGPLRSRFPDPQAALRAAAASPTGAFSPCRGSHPFEPFRG